MTLEVTGYVDGDAVVYEETAPTEYSAVAAAEEKLQYDVIISATDDYGNTGTIHSLFFMEGTWITPVWQRTSADVDRVRYLNAKIRQYGFSSLTVAEQGEWGANLIGAINYWDWNRIEQNTKYISEALNSYGYNNTIVEYSVPETNILDSEGNVVGIIPAHVSWIKEDKPYTEELERIRSNVQVLLDNFYQLDISLPTDLIKPTVVKINTVETIQKQLKEMFELMEKSFRFSGTFYSGQEVYFD